MSNSEDEYDALEINLSAFEAQIQGSTLVDEEDDTDYDLGSDDMALLDMSTIENLEKSAFRQEEERINCKGESKKRTRLLSAPPPAKKARPSVGREDVYELLETYTNEFLCHICQDLLVAPYSANSCGHTIGCGYCAQSWIERHRRSPTCTECREALPPHCPISPNHSLRQIIEQHVEMLAKYDVPGWDKLGAKKRDWDERASQWTRHQARKRQAEAPRQGRTGRRNISPGVSEEDVHEHHVYVIDLR